MCSELILHRDELLFFILFLFLKREKLMLNCMYECNYCVSVESQTETIPCLGWKNKTNGSRRTLFKSLLLVVSRAYFTADHDLESGKIVEPLTTVMKTAPPFALNKEHFPSALSYCPQISMYFSIGLICNIPTTEHWRKKLHTHKLLKYQRNAE